jgi:hypothetical protein
MDSDRRLSDVPHSSLPGQNFVFSARMSDQRSTASSEVEVNPEAQEQPTCGETDTASLSTTLAAKKK